MSLPTTSYSSESKNNFVVGAGVVVRDFKYDSATSKYTFKSFGATTGGSTISLSNELRQMEIDGLLTTPVGGDMIDSSEGTMELNLLEHTLENIAVAVNGTVETSTGDDGFATGVKYVKPSGTLSEEDYIKDLAHISKLANGDYLVVKFDYAICIEGLEMNPQDRKDNTMTITLGARTNPENLSNTALPVKIARILASDLPTG